MAVGALRRPPGGVIFFAIHTVDFTRRNPVKLDMRVADDSDECEQRLPRRTPTAIRPSPCTRHSSAQTPAVESNNTTTYIAQQLGWCAGVAGRREVD